MPVRVRKQNGKNSKGEPTSYVLVEPSGKVVAHAKTKRDAMIAAAKRNSKGSK